ncbi:MAG: Na(+)-translocating NADH-quinone reductase subunit A [Bacteroidales bacterium]|nr:Na(+)-translocating NADH-quinone reductase subunit A [Bacteroidales bacterium]
MSSSVKLKKGLDIRIMGGAEKILAAEVQSAFYGVKPVDFPGLTPKLNVKPGDKVLAGTPLFHDKIHPEILFTSPVSGEVLSITRGDRRKLLEIVVEKEGDEFIDFGKSDPASLSREKIKETLLISGLWPAVRQRPYHIVAHPSDVPKAIFISGFDTAPLAPDYNFIMDNSSATLFRSGISVLKKLTDGKINLVLNGKGGSSELLKKAAEVEISHFSGPHPAGNVGVHIHHLNPINKGEIVWFVNLQDVIAIGRLFEEGIYNHERIIALTGSEVLHPQYYKVHSGASISALVKDNVKMGNLRYISGNVLTGSRIEPDGYLGYYDSQVTVIPEGDYYEFFGWMMPGINKFSFSKTFASSLIPRKSYSLDTNLHGGERAFVMTGQYEKVVPMDIYPMQLLKAILAEDIDLMENLGIYEIAEEDFALCEFICPSKIEIQSIVRKGLDLMIKEMN